jgi:putative transcriptional regulator
MKAKKVQVFDDLMEGFREAIRYRNGKKVALRVTRFSPPKPIRPAEIRRIRRTIHFSQREFASFLGASPGAVRSWEQGIRSPQGATLRLLAMAKRKPAVFLSPK